MNEQILIYLINALWLWGTTIAANKAIEGITILKFVKTLADYGYKIDFKKLVEFRGDMRQTAINEVVENKKILKYIPIINVLEALKFYKEFEVYQDRILGEIDTLGLLEEMTEEEKQLYLKKPTPMNAMFINYKLKISEIVSETEIEQEIHGKKVKIISEIKDGKLVCKDIIGLDDDDIFKQCLVGKPYMEALREIKKGNLDYFESNDQPKEKDNEEIPNSFKWDENKVNYVEEENIDEKANEKPKTKTKTK